MLGVPKIHVQGVYQACLQCILDIERQNDITSVTSFFMVLPACDFAVRRFPSGVDLDAGFTEGRQFGRGE